MQIVVTDLTRMAAPHICVAGIEIETKEHIRPVFRRGRLTTSDLRVNGGVFALGALVDLGAVIDVGRPPELEDRQFEQAAFGGVVTREVFWALLDEVARSTLHDVFGADLVSNPPGRTIPLGSGTASLGCLLPRDTPRLYISPDGRIRMWLHDGEQDINLSVTDLRLYEDDLRTPAAERVAEVARRLRRGVGVRLSVGVGRPYPPADPRHWLQINNVHLADSPIELIASP
ncbi:MAG: hypothetical protein ABIR67_06465 [Gaiellaceae bacterium]